MPLLYWIIKFMAALICPKCGGFSWLEGEGIDLVQVCHCGLTKWLHFQEGATVRTRTPKLSHVSLPTSGSQLAKVLGRLSMFGPMNSGDMARQMRISTDKATTNLSILRSRGLIRCIEERKGRSGGSVWEAHQAVKRRILGD